MSLPAQRLEERRLWPFCWFLCCLTITGMACLSRDLCAAEEECCWSACFYPRVTSWTWQGSLVGGCASVLVSGEFMSALSLGRSPWEATPPRLSEALPHCEAVPRQICVTAHLWRSFWAGPCGLTAILSWLHFSGLLGATRFLLFQPRLVQGPLRLGPLCRHLLTAFTAYGGAGLLVNDKEHLF